MSRNAPITGSSGGDGRPLRSRYQTPLRRSPRLPTSPKPSSPKKPSNRSRRRSAKKTKIPSPPSSPDPLKTPPFKKTRHQIPRSAVQIRPTLSCRRSARLAADSADAISSPPPPLPVPQDRASGEKKSKKRPRSTGLACSSQGPRRSRRLAAISPELAKLGEEGSRRLAAISPELAKSGEEGSRRLAAISPELAKQGEDELELRTPPVQSRPKKRRKMDGGFEENLGNGTLVMEEICNLVGQKKEEGSACRVDAANTLSKEGWTKDQEVALNRAYLSARPSPHFWKKVAKMVPGKSAQECFNRVHENCATPPQPQPRSKTNIMDVSPICSFSLSDGKSTEFTGHKGKRLKSSKKKSLVALKTARHLLRKHCITDKSKEADYFSVLESPSALMQDLPDIRTPLASNCISSPSVWKNYGERSSSSHKSRFSISKIPTQLTDPSPEVLKQIKNVALHEKYIDKLHLREAKRRPAAKGSALVASRDHSSNLEPKDSVVSARTALMSEARDVISHFRQMQSNALDTIEDFDNDDDDCEEDDDDDVTDEDLNDE